ncbi:elongation factor 4 [Candidatus Kuenenbacteria bacterium CG22_combo_CG10-13_8_21_14_all_39_9]|uniref:Elongation factor 4 n=1 Tax=Candidatus Kuenenbacteria bacterium CG22_combo_CG10-13_8_21_14_all_39_9 TaxID=1974621 RepID=A0A2H0D146_9BACT|nr:MAG: elongation factor 4 [Candidatus Kuenenbacteria bacterium CG22_combo_CG10-13_8_21_14_all_39_9]
MNNIRNFCIIAHIDHGKSTLADRFLELTHAVEQRKMRAQYLDQMDLEREKGITIKLQPVKMHYQNYELNLIDTPGHVDFTYEVSRSLAAVEGALLIIDATQGVQAQTIANLYLALEQGLEIIPVLNKIDLPAADIEKASQQVIDLLGCKKDEILLVSAKTGQGVDKVLEVVIHRIPAPTVMTGNISPETPHDEIPLRAMIFDSIFDEYKGVVAYVRVFAGEVKTDDELYLIGVAAETTATEVGNFLPVMSKENKLSAGQIGYIATSLKNLEYCKVGDTITLKKQGTTNPAQEYKELALPGFKEVKSMVFAGIFCKEGSDFAHLRESLGKLKLTDAALMYEPESSSALGFGFRCGFLGLLHLEIITERLKREYGLDLIVTVPSVAYKIKNAEEEFIIIHSPQELPNAAGVVAIEEPWAKVDIVTPKEYLGKIMQLVTDKRGVHKNTEFFTEQDVILHFELPLSSILVDFYDKLKSVTKGYATLNYEMLGYRPADVERLDILVAEEPVEALATIVYKDESYRAGKKIVERLKDILPRQMFEVKIQAVLGYQASGKNKGGKIIASARIPAMRKDVTAKLYGGDVTRKKKLLEKQKKGKKKMKAMGKMDIPQEAYLAVLKR